MICLVAEMDLNKAPDDSDNSVNDDQLISFDPNFFLASEIACDEDDLNNAAPFVNKRARRDGQNQCQNPRQKPKVSQEGELGTDAEEPNYDFKKFIDNQLGTNTPFLKNSEQLCPIGIFGFGLTPVCEKPGITVLIIQTNVLYSDLDNVFPRT